MKTILITLITMATLNSVMARTGTDCKINVYKPDVGLEREVLAAKVINQILIQKGYVIDEDGKSNLTHNVTMAGFGETGCSLSFYGMKRITANADIREGGNYLDLQSADDIETSDSCANLDLARIKATQKLKSCQEL